MRIYIYPAGQAGMALYSYKLANALAEKGIEVSLFVDDKYELDKLPARFNKIKVLSSKNVSVGSNSNRLLRIGTILFAHLYNWHRFYRHIRRERPDVIHVQSLFYLVDWLFLSRFRKINTRVVLTVHDVVPHKFYSEHSRWLELIVLRHMYQAADRLIVHAEINRQQLLSAFPVAEDKVVVVPHGEYSLEGIAREISADEARDILEIDKDQKVILCFGYIRKVKGIDILLRAFDRAAERLKNITLIIAGSAIRGESFDYYDAIIKKMKYGSKVKCHIRYVPQEDIPTFFTASDIVVLPYLDFASQSGVVHLAQGFSKPVITSDVGGLPEVVEDHKTGLIVPPGDVEALSEAITYLASQDELRKAMGQRARKIAIEKFSWQTIAGATIEKCYRL